jgi:hypothetical protein
MRWRHLTLLEPERAGEGPPGAAGAPATVSGSQARGTPAATGGRGSGLLAGALPADLWDCRTALQRIHSEAAAQDRAARAWIPSAAFSSGAPNARLQTEVAPQVAQLWAGAEAAPGLSHQLECRAWACRLIVTIPGDDSGEVGPWIRSISPMMKVRKVRELKLSQPSPRGITMHLEGSMPTQDERSNRTLEKFVFFFGAPPGGPQPDVPFRGPQGGLRPSSNSPKSQPQARVGATGFEPATSGSQNRRATSCATPRVFSGRCPRRDGKLPQKVRTDRQKATAAVDGLTDAADSARHGGPDALAANYRTCKIGAGHEQEEFLAAPSSHPLVVAAGFSGRTSRATR